MITREQRTDILRNLSEILQKYDALISQAKIEEEDFSGLESEREQVQSLWEEVYADKPGV